MVASVSPQALLRQAALFKREGRLPDAIACYKQLLSSWPDQPDTWYNLAIVQRAVGAHDDALSSYQQALAHGVSHPEEALLNRAVIFADNLGQYDAAEKELRAALAILPDYRIGLLNLASLCEDRGRREEALALYERLLASHPDFAEALARYALLRGANSLDDPLIDRLRMAIDRPTTGPADQASLSFALGSVLDRCQSYDEAFAAYCSANTYSRRSAAAPGPLYDRARQRRYVDDLIHAFPRSAPGRSSTGGLGPIFICGMFRSGSTLAEQILGRHSEVQAGGELAFFPELVRARLQPFPLSLVRLDARHFESIAKQYLTVINRIHPGAQRTTDKRPDNFSYIGLIKSVFPAAKIVHTIRNPLDNGLSIFFLNLAHQMGYALDLGDIGHFYSEHLRLMAHWKRIYPEDILEFDYDALVHDPKPAVQGLLTFCGLDWQDECMAFDKAGDVVRTASRWQVRQPLNDRGSGRWRHYEKHLGPLRDALRAGSP